MSFKMSHHKSVTLIAFWLYFATFLFLKYASKLKKLWVCTFKPSNDVTDTYWLLCKVHFNGQSLYPSIPQYQHDEGQNYRTKAIVRTLTLDLHIKNFPNTFNCATRYRLEGARIDSLRGRDFSHLSRPALRLTQPPIKWVPCSFPGSKPAGSWLYPPTTT
jgi:hypothetical protein